MDVLWRLSVTMSWTSYDIFLTLSHGRPMTSFWHYAMDVLWYFSDTKPWTSHDIFLTLCHGRPMTSFWHYAMDVPWHLSDTKPWTSYDVFLSLCHGRQMTSLWQMVNIMPRTTYAIFLADGKHKAMDVIMAPKGLRSIFPLASATSR